MRKRNQKPEKRNQRTENEESKKGRMGEREKMRWCAVSPFQSFLLVS
jgi:hypothetical protein